MNSIFIFLSFIVVTTLSFSCQKATENTSSHFLSSDVTILAGLAHVTGDSDGQGNGAEFYFPRGPSVGLHGNIYISDSHNHTIRVITPTGKVTRLAGVPSDSGHEDGPGDNAKFNYPTGTAVGRLGNIYVCDTLNHVIRKITPQGIVSTFAGTPGQSGSQNGPAHLAQFFSPEGVASDLRGNIYVADSGNHLIRKITPEGIVTTLAGKAGENGDTDGEGLEARFHSPMALSIDYPDNIYVADTGNFTIRKISPSGHVTTFAGRASVSGNENGVRSQATFNHPSSLAIDRVGNIYVSDLLNLSIRKITPDGVVSTYTGDPTQDGTEMPSLNGPLETARFFYPNGIAISPQGHIYVTQDDHLIRKIH